ncbi:H-NS family nucleoid-associated regulatory protein [Azoarcus olearius]|uniref:Trans-acting regulatory protein HvrA n=1 Tax=Azoarcus sp. (strain BH72) TaxID=418699 RepID=A1K1V6_AZOSB|nr:H-NS histone family protein [Azoarcus olearius]ANQ83285.1 putative trans-acting regulatory protein HvrA [Azoarcus olearius]CAL92811.1 putative trans-acting regulatory protein HvrA [Azoarcus olearius]
MEIDLKSYTLPQLRALREQTARAIDRLQRSQRETLLRRLSALARAEGLTLAELAEDAAAMKGAERPRKHPRTTPRQPLPVKYRHPSNRALAWSGRGRQPHWVAAWLANGGSMDALATAAEKLAPRIPRGISG